MKNFVLFTFPCVMIGIISVLSNVKAIETSPPLSIKVIRQSPDIYDGKNLSVAGQVRSLTPGRGRRGSEFMILVLQDSKSESDDISLILTVFSYYPSPLKKGSRVIVKGIYHKEGYWAGSTHDHFMEANEIIPIETD